MSMTVPTTASAPTPPAQPDDPYREYGDRVVAVEPSGVDVIPETDRHGRPRQLLWTWTSPNMEFATITVGLLGPLYFGLTFWQSFVAIVLGTALGSLAHGVLSSWGPRHGLPQMVISRSAFGFLGNILPAGINSLVAGIGWFAVNSVSGALALNALFSALPKGLCLVIVVALQLLIAFFGHNLIQAFERYAFPVLTVIFVVSSIIVLTKAHPSAASSHVPGGFLIMLGATFGYACGWNPYAADYTRYLPSRSRPAHVGWAAALGVFLSCVLLETAGAAVFTAGKTAVNPSSFTDLVPTWLGKLTLAAIALGAVAANALNVYSGSLSFLAMGLPHRWKLVRAVIAVVFALVGLALAFGGLDNGGSSYEDFLLIISYWIGPWLGVVFVDRALRRGQDVEGLITDRRHTSWAGPLAMAIAGGLAIWLFSNQTDYVGPIASASPALGDLTFEVGFVLAALLYAVLHQVERARTGVGSSGLAGGPQR
jgi:NCS1 nucleoside transporter family